MNFTEWEAFERRVRELMDIANQDLRERISALEMREFTQPEIDYDRLHNMLPAPEPMPEPSSEAAPEPEGDALGDVEEELEEIKEELEEIKDELEEPEEPEPEPVPTPSSKAPPEPEASPQRGNFLTRPIFGGDS